MYLDWVAVVVESAYERLCPANVAVLIVELPLKVLRSSFRNCSLSTLPSTTAPYFYL